jgi:hypothetical protein
LWLRRNDLAPWSYRNPPKFYLQKEGRGIFKLSLT